MIYLGIAQHARQITISLRDDGGDVVLAQQASRRAPQRPAIWSSVNVPATVQRANTALFGPKGPNIPVRSMERPHARCAGFQHRDIADILPVARSAQRLCTWARGRRVLEAAELPNR